MGQGGLPRAASGTDVLSAAELGTSGELFIQVVDTGPASGALRGFRLDLDRTAWRGRRHGRPPGHCSPWPAAGSSTCSARAPRCRRRMASRGPGPPDPRSCSPQAPTALSDGRSLVLDNYQRHDPPSVVVQLVPAATTVAAAARNGRPGTRVGSGIVRRLPAGPRGAYGALTAHELQSGAVGSRRGPARSSRSRPSATRPQPTRAGWTAGSGASWSSRHC